MSLRRETGNLLDAKTDAVLVAVDGDHPRLVGAVAHQLENRIDDDREWDRIIREAKYPLGAGEPRVVSLEEVPEVEFKFVIFVNFYNHHNSRLYLDSGYYNALAYAHNWRIRSVATALYKGGWRGTEEQAMAALNRACAKVPTVDVVLYERPARAR